MNEKIIGEKKKINIKLIITILVILIAVAVLVVVILKNNDKPKEKITYVENTKEISKQAKYLNATIGDVITQIAAKKVNDGAQFSKLGISQANYGDCDGKIKIENGLYKVTASCEKDDEKAYTIEQVLIRTSKLNQLSNITHQNNDYVFMGIDERANGVVGVLNVDGTIKWETEIAFDSAGSSILAVNSVSDGHVVTIQNPIDDETSELKIVKLDANGNIVKTNKIKTEAYVLIPKSNFNDMVLVACDDAMYVLDKDGNLIKEITKSGITSIAISNNTIYCIDGNQTIYGYNTNGEQLLKHDILDPEHYVMEFDVQGNQYLVLYNNEILVFDSKGKKVKEYNYSKLGVSEKKHEKGMVVGFYRNGNNFYTSFLVDDYIITDTYDQNFERISRNSFQNEYLNMNFDNYNLNWFIGENIVNINYDSETKMFIKTIYNE